MGVFLPLVYIFLSPQLFGHYKILDICAFLVNMEFPFWSVIKHRKKKMFLVTKAGVEEEAQTEEEEMWIVNVLLESESRKYI